MSEMAWNASIDSVPRPGGVICPDTAGMRAMELRKTLSFAGSRSAVGEAFLGGAAVEFSEPLRSLRQALSRQTADFRVVKPWFGGGEGLTPAWDDLCTGVLLCDRFFARGLVAPASSFIAELSGKTTIQSLWQLRFAETGRSSLVIERFLASLATGPLKPSDAMRIAGLGHTSGNDILCGICLWLEACASRS